MRINTSSRCQVSPGCGRRRRSLLAKSEPNFRLQCRMLSWVTTRAAAARSPGEGPFDDPASRQQNKPALRLRQFHDVQRDALGGGSLRGRFAGVALIDVGKLDAVARGILDIGSKPGYRLSITDIGRRHVQGPASVPACRPPCAPHLVERCAIAYTGLERLKPVRSVTIFSGYFST